MRSTVTTRLPYCAHPCANCPFRKDVLKGWLGEDRMQEILSARSFVCHKTPKLQCAGHMIIKGEQNIFVAMAKHLKIDLPLRGMNLVFDTEKQCLEHHKNSRKKY